LGRGTPVSAAPFNPPARKNGNSSLGVFLLDAWNEATMIAQAFTVDAMAGLIKARLASPTVERKIGRICLMDRLPD
jgi:hypothetical protein